jgi:hypothetical protein
MKFIIAICLIFTHYVCGDPCISGKEPALHISTIENLRKLYKHTKSFTTAETPQIIQPTSRIIYNKRFGKRYRKAPKLVKACLQSNEVYAGFCRYKLAQHILILNHPYNLWLTAYLSLFAVFEV